MDQDISDATSSEERQEQIVGWLSKLIEPGSVVELRALRVKCENGWTPNYSGYYDTAHLGDMARKAVSIDRFSEGVYWTLNPIHHDLLSRRANRTEAAKKGEATSSEHILRRRWLLIDCDPIRIAGVSSTSEELSRAEEVARAVEKSLVEGRHWPVPIRAMSGNGFHLLFRIDLPTDDGGLVRNVLQSLSSIHSTDRVKLDTAVFDPSRICKLYGSLARKGDSTTERPHRMSQIVNLPDEVLVASREQLEQVAGLASMVPAKTSPQHAKSSGLYSPPLPRDEVLSNARSYLLKMDPAIAGQGGHNATFRAATALTEGFGLSVNEAFPLLAEWNQTCQPPWTESELIHKLEGAAKNSSDIGRLVRDGSLPPSTSLTQGTGQSLVSSPPKSQRATSKIPTGTMVRASDRANFGDVVRDDGGSTVAVHFISNEGHEATVDLPRESLVLMGGSPVVPDDFKLNLLTSQEFMATDYRQHFLVKRLLVEGQCCVLGGPKKILKTSLLVDLALSLGTGKPFLEHPDFEVPEAVPVMLLSGESGGFTLRETARRIALAKGVLLSNAKVFWGFTLPQMSEPEHLKVLANQIEQNSIKVAIIDPAYLCLLTAGASANVSGNVFAMGLVLKEISELGLRTNCTIIIAHHTRKADRQKPFDIPDLEDLSGSGFAEWSRQWILLNRREAYRSDGRHALWLAVGGSAGHSGTYHLDVTEGEMNDDFSGRTWKPTLTPAADAIEKTKRSKEEHRELAKERKQAEVLERHCQLVRDFLSEATGPMTKTAIRGATGLNSENSGQAIQRLIYLSEAREAETKMRGGSTFELIRSQPGQPGQPGQKHGICPPVRVGQEVGQALPPLGGELSVCLTPEQINQLVEGRRSNSRTLFEGQESIA